jgi:D-3-phosphoglycerate dehydrogenase
MKYLVFAAEAVSPKGLAALNASGTIEVVDGTQIPKDQWASFLSRADGLIVRSATKVNADFLAKCPALRVVGRAGVGVDNVDVDAATARGILVMNTPAGNTISTCEHALSLMFALARHIPQAHSSMSAGQWDRKSFQGVELYGKTLGIIGMGRIGTEVARRAIALGMRVRVFDPFLSLSRARSLQVELLDTVDRLVPECDFITLHTPLTPETRGVLNARTLGLCKKGVRLINCARGGLINEEDLLAALKSGQVAGVALDVYEVEPPPADWPLRNQAGVILTPHLGASTAEAQENVGLEVAEQIGDYLLNGVVRNSVNLPSVDAKTMEVLRPYLILGRKLGSILSQVGPKRAENLVVRYHGPLTEYTTAPVTRAILEGFLMTAAGSEINQINVTKFAETLGLTYRETKRNEPCDYSELIEVEVTAGAETVSVAGTFFGHTPRIVRFNGGTIESSLEGVLFFFENRDRPGVVGWLGTLLGRHNVNIANMALSRTEPGGRALTILQLDTVPPDAALAEIRAEKDIYSVRLAQLS